MKRWCGTGVLVGAVVSEAARWSVGVVIEAADSRHRNSRDNGRWWIIPRGNFPDITVRWSGAGAYTGPAVSR